MSTESRYPWEQAEGSAVSFSRPLTGTERLFVVLNDRLCGQNCPSIGATVSVRNPERPQAPTLEEFDLLGRSRLAAQMTRWRYPTVACRVADGKKMTYSAQSAEDLQAWARDAVNLVQLDGPDLSSLRERLSKEIAMPSNEGNCCFFYVAYDVEAVAQHGLTTFHVVIYIHHALTDAAGMRSILNEFLTHLADDAIFDTAPSIAWGGEVSRLHPSAIDLLTQAERELALHEDDQQRNKLRATNFTRELFAPLQKIEGHLSLVHTFETEGFLQKLLKLARAHNSTLAPVVQAALFKAVHEFSGLSQDQGTDASYSCLASLDLRNGRMTSPANERNEYVFCAMAYTSIRIPCNLLDAADSQEGFWKVVTHISAQFAAIAKSKGFAVHSDNDAVAAVNAVESMSQQPSKPPPPQTCPYFVSESAGEKQLNGVYTSSTGSGRELILESYQIAADQNLAKVSARSQSWNNKLILCLVFNTVRTPKPEMEKFLKRWIDILTHVTGDSDVW
ncbi:hypothetical protein BX600DRAFT_438496 [Xylariales sp. PMI_506]|nr:hypothetical protein BX600DRAFT_438496 [Xylariales sp. PMI_506]